MIAKESTATIVKQGTKQFEAMNKFQQNIRREIYLYTINGFRNKFLLLIKLSLIL